jgi:hypothetical protein
MSFEAFFASIYKDAKIGKILAKIFLGSGYDLSNLLRMKWLWNEKKFGMK